MRLTDREVKSLKPKTKRYVEWEDGRTGLGCRVSPKGRKTFVFMYRFGGKARRMGLGTYPLISLASARVKHSRAREALSKGIDPGALQVAQKQAERNAETVADLIDEYLEKWARPRKRSAAEDERKLKKEVLPIWGKRKARDITRRDVIKLLDGIVERGAPIQANRILAVVRKMFNFALARDIVDATPVAMVQAPATENQRDRILSADETRIFWSGLEEAPMEDGTKIALKLGLVTAQRKGEIARAAQAEFDFEDGVWTIPADHSKNGKAHRVPLSPLALELIEDAKAIAGNSDWLFPSPINDGSITPHSVNRALMKAMRATAKSPTPAIELENVTPHDLRRTAASGMTALGINRLVVAKILNHVESGVTAVYDRHSYDAEKRHALETWAAHLEGVLSGRPKTSNVVTLATAGETQ